MAEKVEPLDMEDDFSEFTLAEIMEMESSFRGMGETSLSEDFSQKLATKFSCSLHRFGQPSIKWEQVHGWFLNRQKQEVAKSIASPLFLKELVASSRAAAEYPIRKSSPKLFVELSIPSPKQEPDVQPESFHKLKEESAAELSELIFEARSSRDFAWYDVAAFLNYRVLTTGELEVRVRFAGFGNTDDEWVNVKRAVRERSIPLENSECHRVQVGDPVLCYREADDEAIYCDAHIVEIERKLHDIKGCRCIFVVRYDHDYLEGKVQLDKICCRPSKLSSTNSNPDHLNGLLKC